MNLTIIENLNTQGFIKILLYNDKTKLLCNIYINNGMNENLTCDQKCDRSKHNQSMSQISHYLI